MKNLFFIAFTITSLFSFTQVTTKVFDIGPGLCTISKLPNGKVFLYDCGTRENNYQFKKEKQKELLKFLPKGSTIDLAIISHTDADHISGMAFVLKTYNVKELLWTSYSTKTHYEVIGKNKKDNGGYRRFTKELKQQSDIEVTDLYIADSIIEPFTLKKYDNVNIWLLTGFGKPLDKWDYKKDKSKAVNSISITCILEYKGNKIYFGGDAVGCKKDDTTIISSDKYLIESLDKKDHKLLDCDVVIASHHGSSNGTSQSLSKLLNAEYVIYSAGSDYGHPEKKTIKRFFDANNNCQQFPTNKLNNDDNLDEFKCHKIYQDDQSLDDNILITLPESGMEPSVKYESQINQ